MTTYFRIVNWASFQHYRDRAPPWIKLHRELLSSRVWVNSTDQSRVLAIASMLLAAATDNKIPNDPAYVRRVAYLDGDPDFAPLIANGFIEIIDEDGNLLADASELQATARTEKRRGREEKRREEAEEMYVNAARSPVPVEPVCSAVVEQKVLHDGGKLAVDAWNALAGRISLPVVQRLTTARAAALRARLIECGGMDGWLGALAKIEASPFLRGEGGRAQGHDGWRCNFDWLISQRGFTRLLEGAFDSTPGNGGKGALARAMRDLVEQTEEPVQ